MGRTFTVTTHYPVTPAVMFDLSLSIDEHVSSMSQSGESAVDGVTSGTIGLGESVTWRARHFGMWFRMRVQIAEWERPHRFVDQQVAGPFRSFVHEHTFEEVDGGCRMTDSITLASPLLGFLVEPLVLVPYLRRLILRRNASLGLAARRLTEQ